MALPHAVPIYALEKHLPVRVRPASRLSDDDLFELCARNRALRIERTADGELVIMAPTGGDGGHRNFVLNGLLYAWSVNDGTGIGFGSSTGFILPNGAERAPDAAWLRRERWEALTEKQRRTFAPLCPDFVVELRSASDDLAELHGKMEEYVSCGARLGWLIDVDGRHAWVYRPGRPVEALAGAVMLSGEPELPGLVIDLAALA
jgi:Uma2 family endonuclease